VQRKAGENLQQLDNISLIAANVAAALGAFGILQLNSTTYTTHIIHTAKVLPAFLTNTF
jgi:hypothetical protein